MCGRKSLYEPSWWFTSAALVPAAFLLWKKALISGWSSYAAVSVSFYHLAVRQVKPGSLVGSLYFDDIARSDIISQCLHSRVSFQNLGQLLRLYVQLCQLFSCLLRL